MFDLQKAADKMKDAIFREGLEDEERRRVVTVDVDVEEPPPPPPPATGIPADGGGGSSLGLNIDVTKPNVCIFQLFWFHSLPSSLRSTKWRRRIEPTFNHQFWFHSSTACLKNVCISLP
nr:uncharacterized protein LOC109156702 [Ipomoea trifida]